MSFKRLSRLMPTAAAQTVTTPKKGKKTLVSPKAVLTPRALMASTAASALMVRMHAANAAMTSHAEGFAELRRFEKTVRTYGLSKPLLAYADPGGHLQAMVKTLPSLESLDVVPFDSRDSRTTMALRGFKAALEEEVVVMQSWVDGTADSLASLLANVAEQTNEFMAAAGALGETLEHGEVGDEQLGTVSLLAISAEAMATKLAAIHRVLDAIAEPLFDSNDAEEVAEARSVLGNLVSEIASFTGAVYETEDLSVTIDSEAVAEEFIAAEGTLLDKGYTIEKTRELLVQAAVVAGALKALVDRGPAMVERLKTIVVELSPAMPAEGEPAMAEGEVAPADGEAAPAEGEGEGAPEEGGDNNAEAEAEEGEPAQEDDDALVGTPATRSVLSGWVSLLLLAVESGLGAVSSMLTIASEVSHLVSAGGASTIVVEEGETAAPADGEDETGSVGEFAAPAEGEGEGEGEGDSTPDPEATA